ncbi:MAG: PEP-CTERM sorting domain-containing protein [Planctomycetota bacterium]
MASILQVHASADAIISTVTRGSVGSPALGGFIGLTGGPVDTANYQVWAFGSTLAPDPDVRFEVRRNFHVFDLQNIAGTVTGAKIELFHPTGGAGATSFESFDPTETIGFFNVESTSADIFGLASDQTLLGTIFNDLGTGTSLGTMTSSAANEGDFQSATLNAAALSEIQDAIDSGSEFLIGGALLTFNPDATAIVPPNVSPIGSANERVFRGAGNGIQPAARLVLNGVTAIPEPGSLSALAMAASFVAIRRRRQ